jgi:hypothetical protein
MDKSSANSVHTAVNGSPSRCTFALLVCLGNAGPAWKSAVMFSKEAISEMGEFPITERAIFVLFALLMAFTFSRAVARFNEGRTLATEEIGAIETAYLRVQLVSERSQPALRKLFRQYVDARLEFYRVDGPQINTYRKIQTEIWAESVAAVRLPNSDPNAAVLLLPAVNNMIDISNTVIMSLQSYPPRIVYALLFSLGLICSVLIGYRTASGRLRRWFHIIGFTIICVFAIYIALEYPRKALIHLEFADQRLVKIRDAMK